MTASVDSTPVTGHRLRPGGILCDRGGAPEYGGKKKTGDRARDGHEELGLRIGRLAFHLGYTAEDEQRNAPDRHAVEPGDYRVGKLVEYDGKEDADRDGNTHPGIRVTGQLRIPCRKPACAQRPADEKCQQQPAEIQFYLEAE
jgi:hypothetical protein